MSNRADKLEKEMIIQQAKKAEQEVKDVDIQIDVDIIFNTQPLSKTLYVKVVGVPKDLPTEMEDTVVSHAEKIFADMLNSRVYQEFYNRNKTSKDEDPLFINLSRVDAIKVVSIKKIN